MKKVLFITYHFPPIAGGGVFRSLHFVKYLPQFGWQPTVLTVDTKLSWAFDKKLLNEIPQSVKVIRVKQFEWFYFHIIFSKLHIPELYEFIKEKFLSPDSKIGWYKSALKKAQKELKLEKYDMIFSTSPTIVSHMIALKLSEEYEIPWTADFRDFWRLHKNYNFHGTNRGQKEEILEEKIIKNCTNLIVVSDGMKKSFNEKYTTITNNKINVITNGFDREFLKKNNITNTFQITYTGSFYGEYNPKIFIESMQKIIENNPEFAEKVIVKFIGNISDEIKTNIKTKLPNHSEFSSFMNPNDIKLHIENSTILFLFLPNDSHYQSYIPAKLFDYMTYSKPVLAIIPKGDCYDILSKSGLGYFPYEYSEKAISEKLLEMFEMWKNDALTITPNLKYIKQFHREKLTKKLVEVFES